MSDSRPLIWTSKGNLPVDTLRYVTRWQENDDYVKFIETYWLGDELVRESAHVMLKKGKTMTGQQGGL